MRPGLKFLLQKVAGLDVAANQYRLAGASTVLYLHALTHLCSSLQPLDMDVVRTSLAKEGVESEEGGRKEEVASSGEGSEAVSDHVGNTEAGACGDGLGGSVEEHPPLTVAGEVDEMNKDTVNKLEDASLDPPTSQPKPNSAEDRPAPATTPTTKPSQSVPSWKQRGTSSKAKPWDNLDVFLPMLQAKCDSICQQYVDILAESQTESLVDRMSSRPLFFLLAQPEDIGEITRPLMQKEQDEGKEKKEGESEGMKEAEAMPVLEMVMSSAQCGEKIVWLFCVIVSLWLRNASLFCESRYPCIYEYI